MSPVNVMVLEPSKLAFNSPFTVILLPEEMYTFLPPSILKVIPLGIFILLETYTSYLQLAGTEISITIVLSLLKGFVLQFLASKNS